MTTDQLWVLSTALVLFGAMGVMGVILVTKIECSLKRIETHCRYLEKLVKETRETLERNTEE